MRGYLKFVRRYYDCESPEKRRTCITKELAKVRTKLEKYGSDYSFKKNIWKLLFIKSQGFDIEFIYSYALKLVHFGSPILKTLGALTIEHVLFHQKQIISEIKQKLSSDLSANSSSMETALSLFASMADEDILKEHLGQVSRMACATDGDSAVRLKAIALLVSFAKMDPIKVYKTVDVSLLTHLITHEMSPYVNLSLALMSEFIANGLLDEPQRKDACAAGCLALKRMVSDRICHPNYVFHNTVAPFTQIKLLRFLNKFELKELDMQLLAPVLRKVQTRTEITQDVQKSTCNLAILFEAVDLVMRAIAMGYREDVLMDRTIDLTARYISVQDPKLRYMGLLCFQKILSVPVAKSRLLHYRYIIAKLTNDTDNSISSLAVRSLFRTSNSKNYFETVKLFLKALDALESKRSGKEIVRQREGLVTHTIAILEAFSSDIEWYFSIVIRLTSILEISHVSSEYESKLTEFLSVKLKEEALQSEVERKKVRDIFLSSCDSISKPKILFWGVASFVLASLPPGEDESEEVAVLDRLFKCYSMQPIDARFAILSAIIRTQARSEAGRGKAVEFISTELQTHSRVLRSVSDYEKAAMIFFVQKLSFWERVLSMFGPEKIQRFFVSQTHSANPILGLFSGDNRGEILEFCDRFKAENFEKTGLDQLFGKSQKRDAGEAISSQNVADGLGRSTGSSILRFDAKVSNSNRLHVISYADKGVLYKNEDLLVQYIILEAAPSAQSQSILYAKVALRWTSLSSHPVQIKFEDKMLEGFRYSTNVTGEVTLDQPLEQFFFIQFHKEKSMPVLHTTYNGSKALALYLPLHSLHFFYKQTELTNRDILDKWGSLPCQSEFSVEYASNEEFVIEQMQRFFNVCQPSNQSDHYIVANGNFLNNKIDILIKMNFVSTSKLIKIFIVKCVASDYDVIENFRVGVNRLFRMAPKAN